MRSIWGFRWGVIWGVIWGLEIVNSLIIWELAKITWGLGWNDEIHKNKPETYAWDSAIVLFLLNRFCGQNTNNDIFYSRGKHIYEC